MKKSDNIVEFRPNGVDPPFGDARFGKQADATTDQWRARSPKTMIRDRETARIVNRLARVKERIRALEQEEKLLKDILTLKMPIGTWATVSATGAMENDYVIEHLKQWSAPRLSTKKTLQFLKRMFGERIAELVAENCSTPARAITAIYVRPFPQTRTDENED